MTIDLASYPLAFLAGLLSILSPCVWPLVPIILSSALTSGRSGPFFLATGLTLSFALSGSLFTFLLLSIGLGLEILRTIAATLMLLIALTLLSDQAGNWVSSTLSRFTGNLQPNSGASLSASGQFGVGALLGLVWLPCVGPTLGAAIALASMGQNMVAAFSVMLIFAVGAVSGLLLAGLASANIIQKTKPGLLASISRGKKLLGFMLLLLGVLVLTGVDKMLETWALQWLPDWAISL